MRTYEDLKKAFTEYPYSDITVGEFKKIIENYPSDEVPFSITDYGSWRGIYAHPYITPSAKVSKKEELLNDLRILTQEGFEGWKGGWFLYDDDTPLHFEYGPAESSTTENNSCFLNFIKDNKENLFVRFLIKNL